MAEPTLAQRIRAKYPGEYDDMSDFDLEERVLAKYPEYADLPRSAATRQGAPQTPQEAPGRTESEDRDSSLATLSRTLLSPGQALFGTGKRLLEYGHRATAGLMGYPTPEAFKREGPIQEGGAEALDIAAYMVPGGPVRGLAGAAIQGAKAGGVALLQGAEPGMPAALGTAGPLVAGVAGKLAPMLKEGAQRQMARVLGPTTKENKAITEKVVPELLERGFKGATRQSLLGKASAKLSKAGFDLDKALDKVPKGMPVDTAPIIKHLEEGKQAFIVNGVEIAPDAVARLNVLEKTVTDLGPDVSFESLRRVRQIYDRIVADARGFYGKTVAEGSTLNAQRELAGAIRRELAKAAPDVAKVNKEYSFWSNVEKVLEETVERTQSQSKPLGEQVIRGAAIAGGVGGSAIGSGGTAVPLAMALATVNKLIRTPAWNTVSAVNKYRLAELLSSGRFDEAAALAGRMAGGVAARR